MLVRYAGVGNYRGISSEMHGLMRCLVAVLFLATAASWAPMRPFAGRLRASKCRECVSVQMSLRMSEDARPIDALIDQTKDSRAVVVLHYNTTLLLYCTQ